MSNDQTFAKLHEIEEAIINQESTIQYQHWFITELRASLLREEMLTNQNNEIREKLIHYDRWLSGGVYFTTEEFKKYIEERDQIREELKLATEALELTKVYIKQIPALEIKGDHYLNLKDIVEVTLAKLKGSDR